MAIRDLMDAISYTAENEIDLALGQLTDPERFYLYQQLERMCRRWLSKTYAPLRACKPGSSCH